MAGLAGTATNTLKGKDVQKPSDLEASLQQGAALASRLLSMYTSPPEPANTDFTQFEAGMKEAIQSAPAPTPQAVPSVPGGGDLAAGLIGTAWSDIRNGGNANAQLQQTVEDRRRRAEDVEASNLTAANQHQLNQHAQMLEVRKMVLMKTVEEKMANGQAASADKASKELLVVQTALDQLNSKLQRGHQIQLQREQNSGALAVAKMSGVLDFLSRIPAGQSSGGVDMEAEVKELKDLVDFTNSIDLKIAENGRDWTFAPGKFGKKKMVSDEEMSAQLRTAGAYLTSRSPRVQATAEWVIDGILRDKFGEDAAAKAKFLQERGVVVAPPQR